MKKVILILAVIFAANLPMRSLTQTLSAESIQDYGSVSPTVKIQPYRLARNNDIYQAGFASGTIISPNGLILTNSHVVLDYDDDPYDVFAICLSFNVNEEPVCEYSAFLLGYDENLDLALLELSGWDNRGNSLPELPYFNYDFIDEIDVGQSLDIYGYSEIGGKNLTQTQGQVSGFDDEKGIKYIKTDADISSGNSGGTALDPWGNFVGIPTYVMSSYENLGYILDIKEAFDFIEINRENEPEVDELAYLLLIDRLNVFNDAKDTNFYLHPYYPNYSITAENGWEFNYIDKTAINLLYESNEGDKSIAISTIHYPFEMPQSYLDEIIRQINLRSDYLTNFNEEQTTFAGVDATLVTYNIYDQKVYYYIIPYGYAQIEITYSVELDNQEENLIKINEVLDSFVFLEEINNEPEIIDTLINFDPGFTVNQVGDWYIQINEHPFLEDLIAIYHHPEDVDGGFKIYYEEIDNENKELGNTEILEELINDRDWLSGFVLINKDDTVILDDLTGWSLTYSREGDEQDKILKVSEVYLRDNDYVFKFEFEDIVDNYDKYLEDFKDVLYSFVNLNKPEELVGQGIYEVGSLDYIFTDIKYHRFEQEITDLADKEIVTGYESNTFRPEKNISSGKARTFIINSIEESNRTDINESGADFLYGYTVTLEDAMKALVQVYNLNIWQDEYDDAPGWKPYIDKGYELRIIPRGLEDPNQKLTRAEFTYILSELLDNFEVY